MTLLLSESGITSDGGLHTLLQCEERLGVVALTLLLIRLLPLLRLLH